MGRELPLPRGLRLENARNFVIVVRKREARESMFLQERRRSDHQITPHLS